MSPNLSRSQMSPDDLKAAMVDLGLNSRTMAEDLRLGANGDVTVRRWMSGKVPVSGPASVAIERGIRIRDLEDRLRALEAHLYPLEH